MSYRTSKAFERCPTATALPAAPAIGADRHAHVCEACGGIFWHCGAAMRELQPGARTAAHQCPTCGAGPYFWAYETMRDALEVRRLLRAHL